MKISKQTLPDAELMRGIARHSTNINIIGAVLFAYWLLNQLYDFFIASSFRLR